MKKKSLSPRSSQYSDGRGRRGSSVALATLAEGGRGRKFKEKILENTTIESTQKNTIVLHFVRRVAMPSEGKCILFNSTTSPQKHTSDTLHDLVLTICHSNNVPQYSRVRHNIPQCTTIFQRMPQ